MVIRPHRSIALRATATLLGVAFGIGACTGGSRPGPATTEPSESPQGAPPATPSAVPTSAPTPEPTAPGPTPAPLPTTGAWTRLAPSGDAPSKREDQTWTVDRDAGTAWLFGGRNGGTTYGDLWAYDLASDTWSQIVPIGPAPPARFGHDATWVPGRGLIIFGGQANATTFFGDLWQFDPQTLRWTALAAAGALPKARYGSCAALGPDGRLWMSHGFTEDGTRFADTRAYDFTTGLWTDLTPAGVGPVERCLHSCWWTPDGRFVLYAGQTTGIDSLGDLWVLSPGAGDAPGTWAKATIDRPPDRNLYAVSPFRDTVVVVGGRGLGKTFLSDVYVVDPITSAFHAVALARAGPAGRGGAALIDDPERSRLLLFGGKDASGALADIWALTLR